MASLDNVGNREDYATSMDNLYLAPMNTKALRAFNDTLMKMERRSIEGQIEANALQKKVIDLEKDYRQELEAAEGDPDKSTEVEEEYAERLAELEPEKQRLFQMADDFQDEYNHFVVATLGRGEDGSPFVEAATKESFAEVDNVLKKQMVDALLEKLRPGKVSPKAGSDK